MHIEERNIEYLENKVWELINEIWDEIQGIVVPEEQREDVDEYISDVAGSVVASDGVGATVEIYPKVDMDKGRIVLISLDTGKEYCPADFWDYKVIYDPFALHRWLKDIKDAVLEKVGGANNC